MFSSSLQSTQEKSGRFLRHIFRKSDGRLFGRITLVTEAYGHHQVDGFSNVFPPLKKDLNIVVSRVSFLDQNTNIASMGEIGCKAIRATVFCEKYKNAGSQLLYPL